MNARQIRSLAAALTLGFSGAGFAQTFSHPGPVPDRAHDGDRGEESRQSPREVDRNVDRMLRNEERFAREQQQRAREQRREERGNWQRPAPTPRYEDRRHEDRRHDDRRYDDRRYEERRYDGRHRDMQYHRGAGPRHDWYPGSRLPSEYRSRRYVVEDWRGHRLSAPPSGYHWVQAGGDYVLVAIATGIIAQLLLNP
jgi:Ni/Co efflux regulator RcnB